MSPPSELKYGIAGIRQEPFPSQHSILFLSIPHVFIELSIVKSLLQRLISLPGHPNLSRSVLSDKPDTAFDKRLAKVRTANLIFCHHVSIYNNQYPNCLGLSCFMSEPSGIIPSSRAIAPSVKRHSRYYFTDGNVVLQVEGVLFKVRSRLSFLHMVLIVLLLQVHSSLLIQESETFKDMFTLPTAHGLADQQPVEHEHKAASQEGTCDETPIVIPEVTQTSFSNFLFAFYGR